MLSTLEAPSKSWKISRFRRENKNRAYKERSERSDEVGWILKKLALEIQLYKKEWFKVQHIQVYIST